MLGQDWCSVASHAADVAMAMELQRQVGAGSPSFGVDAACRPGGLAAGPAAGAAQWFCKEFREQMDPADAPPWPGKEPFSWPAAGLSPELPLCLVRVSVGGERPLPPLGEWCGQ